MWHYVVVASRTLTRVPATPVFLRVTLKNWELPGDEAIHSLIFQDLAIFVLMLMTMTMTELITLTGSSHLIRLLHSTNIALGLASYVRVEAMPR